MKFNVANIWGRKDAHTNAPKARELKLEGLETRELLSVAPGAEFVLPDVAGGSGYVANRCEAPVAAYCAYERSEANVDYDVVKLDETATLFQSEPAAPELEQVEEGAETPAIIVTTPLDVVDATDNLISLREAIAYAADSTLGDTITFDAALNNATITLAEGQLVLDRSIKIDASALDSLTIDAAGRSRVLWITDPNRSDDVDVDVELTGLTITGGYGATENGTVLKGGGVCVEKGSATLTNCVVTNNCGEMGGGIYVDNFAVPSYFVNCTISGNTAFMGGGAAIYHGMGHFDNCLICDNTSTSEGFEYLDNNNYDAGNGGGLYLSDLTTLTNCTITNNQAKYKGKGDGGQGGGIFGGRCLIANCVVSRNTARIGGGIEVHGVNWFSAANSLFVENTATDSCGGIGYMRGTMTNCTIAGNTAPFVGGFHCFEDAKIRNSIIVNNLTDKGETSDCYRFGIFHNTLVGAGTTFVTEQDATVYYCDPTQTIFTDAANGDYSLANNSIAIDLGNADYLVGAVNQDVASFIDNYISPELAQYWLEGIDADLAGNERATLGAVDLGAYEYQGARYTLAAPVIVARETEAGTINFEWTTVPYAKKYYISYALEGGAATNVSAAAGDTSYTLSGLQPNGTYHIKIRATSASSYADASAWSPVATIVARDPEAPSLVVTTLEDVVDKYDDVVSLREAVAYAAADPTLGDTITFDASLDGGTITLTRGQISVESSITIDASALTSLTVNANDASYGFSLIGVNNALQGLTITGGISGGVYIGGAGVSLTNCTISNSGGYGVYMYYGAALTNCSITNNGNSGVYVDRRNATLVNCVISGNTAYQGGGVQILRSATATLVYCTVVGNTARQGGGGAYVYSYNAYSQGTLALCNTIVVDNVGGDFVKYNSSYGSIVGYNTLSSFTEWDDGADNYVYDPTQPLFTDAANGDYTLVDESVAIDAGDAAYLSPDITTDRAGSARVVGAAPDLGAFEHTSGQTLDAPNITVYTKRTNAITLRWNAVDGATGYVFEYKEVGAAEFTVVNLAANKLQRQISNLTEGGEYLIRIKALAGDGALDSEYAEITAVMQRTLATPVVALTNADESSLAFAWEPIDGAIGYKVMYKAAADAAYTTVELDANPSVTLTGLQMDTNYSVKVCALGNGDDFKTSAYSTLTAYRTINPFQLVAPTLVATDASNDSILIHRDAVPNATKYYIAYAPVGTSTFTTKSTPATNLFYRIQGLEPNTEYQIKLRTVGSGDYINSKYSAVTPLATTTDAFVKTALDVPTVTVSTPTSGSLRVEWTPNPRATAYTLIHKLKTDSEYATVAIASTETTFLVEGLTPGATYYAKVRAIGDGTFYTNSAYCATKVVTTPTSDALLDEAFAELFEEELELLF